MLLRIVSLIALSLMGAGQPVFAGNVPVLRGIAQDHFVWPREQILIDWAKFTVVKVDLPYLSENDGPKPSLRNVFYLDLRGDGAKEMIVDLGRDGITRDYAIFQRNGAKWEEIGAIIGLAKICVKANGYCQIESDRNFKGGSTGRNLYRFIKGRYQLVRSESYERGVLTNVTYAPDGTDDEGVIYDKE